MDDLSFNKHKNNNSVKNIFWIAPIIIMAIGFLPMPYGYYNLSRLVVCGCSIFYAFNSYKRKEVLFVWIFGFFAVLYNPIIPIHLYDKEIWMVVNVITGVLFFLRRNT